MILGAKGLSSNQIFSTVFCLLSGADAADIVHVPSVQFAYPDVSIAFDADPYAPAKSCAHVLEYAAVSRDSITGMHFAGPHVDPSCKTRTGLRPPRR